MTTTVSVTSQQTENPNVKVYHTRFEMCSGPESGTRGDCDKLGPFGQIVLLISGVVKVDVCPYILVVTKATLYDWQEISPVVDQILSDFSKSQKQLAQVAEEIANEQVGPLGGDERNNSPRSPIPGKATKVKGPLQEKLSAD